MTEKKEDEKMESKHFKGWLILNWKNQSMKIRKTKPGKSKVSPYEIPVRIDMKVNIPKQKEISAKGEIDVPRSKVREMLIESI